jgi:CheY-like chemotaxis protein
MAEGGAIDIKVDCEDVKHLGHADLKPGRYLRVRLADTGCGMDAETLAKAVEPFFSTKPAGKGTGLGLSMTHGLTKQLGGALNLKSELNKGTVATLYLPAALTPPEAPREDGFRIVVERVARILVVDDDPLVAMSTVDMLTDLGHSVVEANCGERALKILDSGQSFDLLITDQAMPGMTGIELASRVRVKREGLPVLLVTGYADVPACNQARLPRLSKPYTQAQLQVAIEELLGDHESVHYHAPGPWPRTDREPGGAEAELARRGSILRH